MDNNEIPRISQFAESLLTVILTKSWDSVCAHRDRKQTTFTLPHKAWGSTG